MNRLSLRQQNIKNQLGRLYQFDDPPDEWGEQDSNLQARGYGSKALGNNNAEDNNTKIMS